MRREEMIAVERLNTLWFLAAFVVLSGFALFFELGRMDVVQDNEGQRATPPAEMLRTGNFVIPTINEKDYLSKPPLLYWTIAALYWATGSVSPCVARFPSAVCALGLALALYGWGRREAGETPARWAAVAFLVGPYVLERSRVAELDVPLTLAIFGMTALFRSACLAESRPSRLRRTWLAGLCLGAAILLKGPVPFLFLYPAWLAILVTTGTDRPGALLTGIRIGIRCFLLEVGLKLLALGAMALYLGLGLETPGGLRWLRYPYALIAVVLLWTVLAWQSNRALRRKSLAILGTTAGIGLLVAAPWCAAVLRIKGWGFVEGLLNSEVVQRTHTATAINSGMPWYYLVALPGMLMPWGLLLPFHFSRKQWLRRPEAYRFSLAMGWIAILFFSLIAGKEYEYILPAVPFLALATGFLLADVTPGTAETWFMRWALRWRDASLWVLSIGGVGVFVYIVIEQHEHVALLLEAALLSAAALGLASYGLKHKTARMSALAVVALFVILMGLLSQDYHYTGKNSYKRIAETAGAMTRAGYPLEAVKMTSAFDVYPGFAFYAATRIPTVDPSVDPEGVRRRLEGSDPYYCVVRQRIIDMAEPPLPEALVEPLQGPFTSKKLLLIGNRPLPYL